MKKKLLILVVGVIAIFNLSILIENNDGINIGLDYLKVAKADTENIESKPSTSAPYMKMGWCPGYWLKYGKYCTWTKVYTKCNNPDC